MDTSTGGTKAYMAPEAEANCHNPREPAVVLSPSTDAWSIGIMLLQVLFLEDRPRTDVEVSFTFVFVVWRDCPGEARLDWRVCFS